MLHEAERDSYRARKPTGYIQLFEIIISGRHLWPGNPPFIREVLVLEGECTAFLASGSEPTGAE